MFFIRVDHNVERMQNENGKVVSESVAIDLKKTN